MSDDGLRFSGLDLVCDDVEATIAFYRLLGVAIPDDALWRGGGRVHHVHGSTIGECELELHSPALAAEYHAGYRDAPTPGGTMLTFGVATRAAVDRVHRRMVAAGHPDRQVPYDAFWGARFAIVADPDGRDVGIMSPSDAEHRAAPPDL